MPKSLRILFIVLLVWCVQQFNNFEEVTNFLNSLPLSEALNSKIVKDFEIGYGNVWKVIYPKGLV